MIDKAAPSASADPLSGGRAAPRRIWQRPRFRRLATSSAELFGGAGADGEVFS